MCSGNVAVCTLQACCLFVVQSGKVFFLRSTELTCTEKLQSFHKAKPFAGSPIKIEELSFSKRNEVQKSEKLQFDPRPQEFRNSEGYNDCVKNLTIRFSSTAPGLPLMQVIKQANPFALEEDH